jgi:hypothetical protein
VSPDQRPGCRGDHRRDVAADLIKRGQLDEWPWMVLAEGEMFAVMVAER